MDTHGAVDYQAIDYLTALILLRLLTEKPRTENFSTASDYANKIELLKIWDKVSWQSIQQSSYPNRALYQAIDEIAASSNEELRELLESLRIDELIKNPELCRQLIEIVSSINFDQIENDDTPSIVDKLISTFADASGEKGGEFYTPENLATLLANILDPEPDKKILDPACGTGGLLLKAYEYADKKVGSSQSPVYLFGQDINSRSVAIARANALLHGISTVSVKIGDSLVENKFNKISNKFDFILTNPPIGLRHDDSTLSRLKFYGAVKFQYGQPTRVADANFVQLASEMLSEDGRAVLLIGLRFLITVLAQESKIRENLVEADLIESVITLPKNILAHTTAQPAILVLNRKKSSDLQRKILFVYADKEFKDISRSRRIIDEENQKKIIDVFSNKREQKHFSAIVSLEKLRENNYILRSADYVGIRDFQRNNHPKFSFDS